MPKGVTITPGSPHTLRTTTFAFVVVSALIVAWCWYSSTSASLAGSSTRAMTTRPPRLHQTAPIPFGSGGVPTCGPTAPGMARCDAIQTTNANGTPLSSSSPTAGYFPADLQSAYQLPSITQGNGETVAVVDAYNDAHAESDLDTYRSQFDLPTCTTANGCFSKINQTGGSTYPANDASWDQEISVDLDMVSAICPNCHILLVEANSSSVANLGSAVDEAASLGADAISNSYGTSEFSTEEDEDSYYDHPGIAITASTGDTGYGTEWPAASPYVTAVGGTSLLRSTTIPRGWSETAWSGTGSGCSSYEPKPTWQDDSGCSHRTLGDVSAVADPDTGVAVYDSVPYDGSSGWLVFGGTSVSSAIIASVYTSGGPTSSVDYGSYPYSHTAWLNNVTAGSNGSCGGGYLLHSRSRLQRPNWAGDTCWRRGLRWRSLASNESPG